MFEGHAQGGLVIKQQVAGDHLIQNDAQRINVAGLDRRRRGDSLFRGDVVGRAEGSAEGGLAFGVDQHDQPKIGQDGLA